MTAGDTDPSDAFDPAVQWAGFATDTFDGLGSHTVDGGGPVDQPAVLTCGGALTIEAGAAGHPRRSPRTDPDDTIIDLAVTAVEPGPGRRLDQPYRVHPGRRAPAAPPRADGHRRPACPPARTR